MKLHRVAWELRPASISELGLEAALAHYVADWSAQSGIATDFHRSGGAIDDLSEDARTTIYRVAQEALTNIAKHSPDARRVSVVFNRTETIAQLTVEDDGNGFDPSAAGGQGAERKVGGLGLAGMRERLSLVGGELQVETSPGIGTTIFARIPVEPARAE